MRQIRGRSGIVPALVVGLDLNGLGLLRALGRAGAPVIGLDVDLSKPTAASRYGTRVQLAALSGTALINDLLTLRQRFTENPVLLLTQEASVVTVSAERHRLQDLFRFSMPSHALMEALLDKSQFQALAEKHGSLIPRGVKITGDADTAAAKDLRYPCVLKPTAKRQAYGKRFAKAYKISSAEDVTRLWSEMRDVAEEIIVQEWIEGDDSDIYFCLQYRPASGGNVISFCGRKTVQWPIAVGGTACCVSAPEHADELTALTNQFFEACGFVGVGSMEYKRDRRDGKFYMIEPTVGRTDYQEEIAALNGVNIPYAAYLCERGLSPPHPVTMKPRAWRDPLGYARARAKGASDPVLYSGTEICDAYFRLYDPAPYISLKLRSIKRRFFGSQDQIS